MACKTEVTTISGSEYACTQYAAIQGLTYKLKVIKLFGPVLDMLLPVLSNPEATEEQQVEALTSSLGKLFAVADPEEVAELLVSMLTTGSVSKEGTRITRALFEEYFSGDSLMDAYKVFFFVLRTNYSGLMPSLAKEDVLTAGLKQ